MFYDYFIKKSTIVAFSGKIHRKYVTDTKILLCIYSIEYSLFDDKYYRYVVVDKKIHNPKLSERHAMPWNLCWQLCVVIDQWIFIIIRWDERVIAVISFLCMTCNIMNTQFEFSECLIRILLFPFVIYAFDDFYL